MSNSALSPTRTMSRFWFNWLTIWCWLVFAFGVVLALYAFDATRAPTQFLLDQLSSHGAIARDAPLRFAVGLQGALTMGWALTILAAIRAAALLGENAGPVWRLATISLLVWYVIDSSISVATGFALNAVSNTLLVVGFVLPVVRSDVLGRS